MTEEQDEEVVVIVTLQPDLDDVAAMQFLAELRAALAARGVKLRVVDKRHE